MQIKTDRGTYLPSPIINPNSLGPAGWWFIDGLSGVKITRLTDERDGAGFGTTYAIWPTANCDSTRLWVYGSATNSYYTVGFDPVSGTRIGPLKPVVPKGAQHYSNYESALWSGVSNDKIFLFIDAKLYAYQPSQDLLDSNGNQIGNPYTLVKDLTPQLGADYYFLQQHKSADDKRFAASGPLGFVVYDVEQDRILLDVRTTDMNGIALDRSGKWLLYVPEDDHIEYVYNVDTGTREQLTSDRTTGLPDFTVGHLDVGGAVVAGNDRWAGAITFRQFSSPHQFSRPFVYAPYWISHHLSMTAADENWALLSTYLDVVGPDPNKFKDEVFQIGIQGDAAGKIRRLFHHRALANSTDFAKRYWQLPKANSSPDGRFAFFTSNMGGTGNHLYSADLGTVTTTPPVDPPIPPDPPTPQPPIVIPPTDPTTPVVAITSPVNNSTVSDVITVTATVTNGEQVVEVYLIVDGEPKAQDSIVPYQLRLDTKKLVDGPHSLMVRAWDRNGVGWDAIVNVTVRNVITPPVDPPPQPKPCSIKATPEILDIPRNGTGEINVTLENLTEPTTVTVSGWDGQVSVSPTSKIASPTSAILSFRIKVKNKKMSREIKFQCGCGVAAVSVNVT